MKRLIVNADDFGTDEPRSRGILAGVRGGIVTSASVIANLAWTQERRASLQSLTAAGAGIGVHLNLTHGTPRCDGATSLIRADGSFYPKPSAWRRALRGGYDPEEAGREFSAQIQALCEAGCTPDHIDGNNHVHVFPGLARAAAQAAARFGIRAIRLPREPLIWSVRQPGRAVLKKCLIALLSRGAEKQFREAGLCFPDRCAGLHEPAVGDELSVAGFLSRLPEGVTELMCHPGYAATGNTFSSTDRERELGVLTSERIVKAVRDNAIKLITFRDIQCA